MVGYLRDKSRVPQALALLIISALGALGAYAAVVMAGTKRGPIIALACIFGPALAYAALVAPLMFPFALYIAVVPFDNVVAFSSFGTITKLLGIASAGSMIFYVLRTKRTASPPKLMVVWILLYLWMFATTFWALDPPTSFALLPTWIMLFGLYFIVSLVPLSYGDLRRIVIATIVSFSAAAAYGAYLFHSGKEIGVEGRLFIGQGSDAYIDPNHFAAALLLPIALAVVCVLREQRRIAKLGYIAAILVLFAGLAVSQSRGALLGLAAMMIWLYIRTPYRKQLGIVLGVMGAGGAVMFGKVLSRFGNAISTGGAGRWDIWRVGVEAFKRHWLIGAGFNNFPFAYDESYIHISQNYWARFHRAPHDLLLQTGVELGIIGIVLMMAAWFGHFDMLKRITPADPRYGLRVAVEAGIIGLFCAAIFLDVMAMKYAWLTFILALLVRNAVPERTVHGPPVSPVLPPVR